MSLDDHSTVDGRQYAIYCENMLTVNSSLFPCLIKVMAALPGTHVFFYHPLHFIVFFLFEEYLVLASFLWLLDGHTSSHSRTQSQIHYAIY